MEELAVREDRNRLQAIALLARLRIGSQRHLAGGVLAFEQSERGFLRIGRHEGERQIRAGRPVEERAGVVVDAERHRYHMMRWHLNHGRRIF
jgi:hypothetical protein